MSTDRKLTPLFTKEQIRLKTREIAKQVSADYREKKPVLIAVLKGSFVFLADIIRDLSIDVTVEFVQISSYGSAKTSSGTCTFQKDLTVDIHNRDVLVIEDIIDSGNTLNFFLNHIKERNPASIRICALIDKTVRRRHDLTIDYSCFEIANEFVVGYGLDHDEQFRHLSGIYELTA